MYKINIKELASVIHKYDLNNGFSGLYYPSEHYFKQAEDVFIFLQKIGIPLEKEE